MKEQLISYETAVLAKDKGFENKTPHKLHRNYYNHLGELNGDVIDYIKALVAKEDTTNFDTIDAPTQSLLQKWLREVHGIDVFIRKSPNGKNYDWDLDDNDGHYQEADEAYETYEKALEYGLKEALTLI